MSTAVGFARTSGPSAAARNQRPPARKLTEPSPSPSIYWRTADSNTAANWRQSQKCISDKAAWSCHMQPSVAGRRWQNWAKQDLRFLQSSNPPRTRIPRAASYWIPAGRLHVTQAIQDLDGILAFSQAGKAWQSLNTLKQRIRLMRGERGPSHMAFTVQSLPSQVSPSRCASTLPPIWIEQSNVVCAHNYHAHSRGRKKGHPSRGLDSIQHPTGW